MSIHVLDQSTINQIAAGEVVDRPSSVVKELVENAIDAGSSAITVEIKDGGISFIRITDNGCGIEKNDVKVAFLRHSTSKIKDATDLITISSLGFRGEALSSISAVAQVELITKTKDSLCGIRYEISGGEEKSFEEIGVSTKPILKENPSSAVTALTPCKPSFSQRISFIPPCAESKQVCEEITQIPAITSFATAESKSMLFRGSNIAG